MMKAHVMASLVMLLILSFIIACVLFPIQLLGVLSSLLVGLCTAGVVFMFYQLYMSLVEAFR